MNDRVYIGLGGNLGDVSQTFEAALTRLGQLGVMEIERSSWIRSVALTSDGVYDEGAPTFLNGVVRAKSELNPRGVLEALLRVEADLGRVRSERWAARRIDLDLLLFGNETIEEQDLRVPHPEMLQRAFVLQPLAEIAPDGVIPGESLSIRELADSLGAEGLMDAQT